MNPAMQPMMPQMMNMPMGMNPMMMGMNPMMKGSAAFIGLRTPAIADFADFFDPEIFKGLVLARAQAFAAEEATPKGKPRRIKRSVAVRKDRTDE